LSYPESYPSQSRAVVGQLGICWARTSRLVTLGTAFINFLTVVARSGVPSEITRSQSNDTSAVSDALRVAMTDGQLAQNAYAITERYRAADSVGPAGYSERRKLIRSC
jgi:hypothetical protein